MNFLKDYFYKRNDVIVVLIILIAAAVLIYDRVNVIMDYPEKYAQQAAAQSEEVTVDEAIEDAEAAAEDAQE